jgi:hypothetical protein
MPNDCRSISVVSIPNSSIGEIIEGEPWRRVVDVRLHAVPAGGRYVVTQCRLTELLLLVTLTLRLLHLENDKRETAHSDGVTAGVTGGLLDAFDVAERAAIAIELGRVPPAYADAWAAFQTRKPANSYIFHSHTGDVPRKQREFASRHFDSGPQACVRAQVHG